MLERELHMPDPAIATAADYADAMLTARRAKNVLILLLLLALLIQLALFFTARYSNLIVPTGEPVVATQPVIEPGDAPAPAGQAQRWQDVFHYVLGGTVFLGVTLTIVLALVLLLIVSIMLVGRLIGVARTTSAFIWCLVLLVLIFPWQAFLRDHMFESREFFVPGILYTWDELLLFAKFPERWDMTAEGAGRTFLHWVRFAAFPVVGLILLLVIQAKSNRGMREALGETTYTRIGPENQI
jgi:hypothetical protein